MKNENRNKTNQMGKKGEVCGQGRVENRKKIKTKQNITIRNAAELKRIFFFEGMAFFE